MKKIILNLVFFGIILFGNIHFLFAEEKKEDFSKYKLEDTFYYGNVGVANGDLYFLEIEDSAKEQPLMFYKHFKYDLYKNFQKQKNITNIRDLYFNKNNIFYRVKENNKIYFKKNNKNIGDKFDDLTDISFDNDGNIYALGKIGVKYFLVKNGKKISKDFIEINSFSIKNFKGEKTFSGFKKYYILNNDFYLLISNNGKEAFYKNNIKIFEAEYIRDIYYNKILKKFYYKFVFGEVKGLSDGKNIIISNFIDKNLPDYFDVKFSKDGKSLFLVNYYNKKYKIIGNISKEEEKELLEKKEETKYSFDNNKIDFTKYIKFGFTGDGYGKIFYSTDKRFVLLKKLWNKYYSKYKYKLTEKKLNLLVNKIANKMKTIKNIKKKETYLFLLLIIKDSSDKLKSSRIYKEEEENLKNYKHKVIGYEYEPRYYVPEATPIQIKGIKKTYDKENNRFILEVESVLDKDKRASDYYWWSTSNGYFKEIKNKKGYYKKVYFYPASVKPLSDYKIVVNGGDNLGFVDSSSITIKKDEFEYEKIDSSKVKTKLEVVKNDQYAFGTDIYSLTINAGEEYLGKKYKPENYSIYLKKVDGKEVDKKLVSKGSLDSLIIGKDKTIRFFLFGYSQKSEYFGKELEFEIELTFPHSVKSITYKTIYLPTFRIRGSSYGIYGLKDFIDQIYIGDFKIFSDENNEVFFTIPNEYVEKKYKEYLKNGKKGDFKINLKVGYEIEYYGKMDLLDISLNFNNFERYISLNAYFDDLDKEKIKDIKNKYAKAYFEYLLAKNDYSNYSNLETIDKNFKEKFEQIKKELETKEKNNLELQSLYLKILNNNSYLSKGKD